MINNTKQRIVVLGAAGFIGFHLSKKLIETGNYTLILIDNLVRGVLDSEFKSVINSMCVQFLELDLSNEISYKNLFLENDIVVNCAALNGTQNFYKNPVNVVRHSAVSAIFAAENAARAKVKKYIYFGTPESYAGGVSNSRKFTTRN
jgi:nucleoside-diphosphate-sugar epimerase